MTKKKRLFERKDFDCEDFTGYDHNGKTLKPLIGCVDSITCNWDKDMMPIRIGNKLSKSFCSGFYREVE